MTATVRLMIFSQYVGKPKKCTKCSALHEIIVGYMKPQHYV